MAIVTDFEYHLEKRLVTKLDIMIDRVVRPKPKKDALLIVEGSEGEGKCLKAGSKILMASGEWKNVEDVKEDDLIISPQPDGSHVYSKVTGLSKWYSKENYDVVQLNKEKKILYSCSYNHIIPINIRRNPKIDNKIRYDLGKWKIEHYEAKDLFKLSKSFKKDVTTFTSFKIDRFLNQNNCKIEPYTLGVYLGDGCYSVVPRKDSEIKKISITNSKKEIIDYISKYYSIMSSFPKDNTCSYYFSNQGDFVKLLDEYGLKNKKSGTKFIPKSALLSDSNYRVKLLAGLIDTDGYYYHGGYQFTQKSKQLVEDIKDLVYSLGGRTGKIIEVRKKCQNNFEGTYYKITCYLGDLKLPLIKDYKTKKDKSFYLSSNRISIDVKKSEPGMVYGFSLDSKSKWFITDNWTITHNTNTSIALAYYIKCKTKHDIHMFFSLEKLIQFAQSTTDKIIIWDEPAIDSLSTDWYKKVNKDLIRLLMTVRKNRHFFIFNFTKFYKFSEYIVVDRALGLIHMYSKNETIPGRFFYIKRGDLEKLFNTYKANKKRLYRKCSAFGGGMVEVMEKYFDKMGINVEGIANATLKDYEREKDKGILGIGKEVSKGEVKLNKRDTPEYKEVRTLKTKIGKLKFPINSQIEFSQKAGIPLRTIREWGSNIEISTSNLGKTDLMMTEAVPLINI